MSGPATRGVLFVISPSSRACRNDEDCVVPFCYYIQISDATRYHELSLLLGIGKAYEGDRKDLPDEKLDGRFKGILETTGARRSAPRLIDQNQDDQRLPLLRERIDRLKQGSSRFSYDHQAMEHSLPVFPVLPFRCDAEVF